MIPGLDALPVDQLADVALQAAPTPPESGLDDPFLDGRWYDGIVLPFTDLLGPVAAVLVAIVGGVVMLEWSDSMAVPTVLGILVGGYLITFLPAPAQVVAYLGLLVGGALALYGAWNGGGTAPR